MKNLALPLIVLLVAGGTLLAIWIWNSPPGTSGSTRNFENPAVANEPARPQPSAAESADQKMDTLKSAAERQAHLDWIAAQDWAKSDLAVLRRTMVADPDENVQVKAVEVALGLATKEGAAAEVAVVKTALASAKGNTRARGLRAAREKPQAALVPTLLELVDNMDPYTTMALNALAHTADERAKARITAIAKDLNADPQVRQRAVALIAVTRDEEGHQYLIELSNGGDEALAKLALEVLKAWNE